MDNSFSSKEIKGGAAARRYLYSTGAHEELVKNASNTVTNSEKRNPVGNHDARSPYGTPRVD